MRFDKSPELGARFQFQEDINTSCQSPYEITQKIAIMMAEQYDDAIVAEIAKKAAASGITDLTVLNKQAIIEALERKIPQKPYHEYIGEYLCPNKYCIRTVYSDMKFCPECGQALNWSDDNG